MINWPLVVGVFVGNIAGHRFFFHKKLTEGMKIGAIAAVIVILANLIGIGR